MHNKLDPILLAQHALVTRFQAWEAGLTPRQVDYLLTTQRLIPVYRGVFRDPAAPNTLEQRALAAVLASGSGTLASHRLAVAVWGMRNYQCSLMEITAPGVRRLPGVVAHRSMRPAQQTVVRGVPITTTARTIIDVATLVNRRLLSMWIETWLSSKLLLLDDLEEQMIELKGHAGVPLVRASLTSRTILHAEADSPPEAVLGLLLERSGLPPLTLHHVVTTTSGNVYELDWSYPELKIAFEMDGYGVHLRSLEAFENDRVRRNELEIDDWKVLNFTKRMVEKRPHTVIDQARRQVERANAVRSTTTAVVTPAAFESAAHTL